MKIFKNIFTIRNVNRLFCTKAEVKDEKYYEKEWNNAYLEKIKKNKDTLEQQLSPIEKKECDLISEAITSLDSNEKTLFTLLLNQRLKKTFNKSYTEHTLSNPSQVINKDNLWPKDNPNWMKSSHLQSTLSAFTGKATAGNISIM